PTADPGRQPASTAPVLAAPRLIIPDWLPAISQPRAPAASSLPPSVLVPARAGRPARGGGPAWRIWRGRAWRGRARQGLAAARRPTGLGILAAGEADARAAVRCLRNRGGLAIQPDRDGRGDRGRRRPAGRLGGRRGRLAPRVSARLGPGPAGRRLAGSGCCPPRHAGRRPRPARRLAARSRPGSAGQGLA